MKSLYALKLVSVFGALYFATSPIRHPNFNSIWFAGPLLLFIFLFALVIQRKNLGIRTLATCVIYGVIASSASYFLDWAMQGNDGVRKYLKTFGVADFLVSLLTTPLFCYAALLLPLSYLILNKFGSLRNRATNS